VTVTQSKNKPRRGLVDSEELKRIRSSRLLFDYLVFGTLVLISLAVLTAVAWNENRQSEQQALALHDQLQQQVSARAAAKIRETLRRCERELLALDSDGALAQFASGKTGLKLPRELSRKITHGQCGSLSIFGSAGEGRYPTMSQSAISDAAQRSYLSWARKSSASEAGAGLFGPDLVPRDVGGPQRKQERIVFDLVLPLAANEGGTAEFAGAAIIRVPLPELLRDALTLVKGIAGSRLWILDSDDRLLWQAQHPDQALSSIKAGAEKSRCKSCHGSFSYLEPLFEQVRGATSYQAPDRPMTLVAHELMTYQSVNWIVAVSSTYAHITSFQRHQGKQSFLSMLAVVSLLLLGLAMIYRRSQQRQQAGQEARYQHTKKGLIKKLRYSEQRYRNVIESAHDLIWATDMEGHISFVNQRVAEITQTPQAQLEGKSLIDLVHPADVRTVKEAIINARQGKQQSYQMRLQGLGREHVILAMNTIAWKDGGQIIGTVNFGRDITHQVRVEQTVSTKSEQEHVLNTLLQLALTSSSLQEKLDYSLREILSIQWLPKNARGGILLSRGPIEILEMVASVNLSEEALERCGTIEPGNCICGRAAANQSIIFASSDDPRHDTCYEGMEPHKDYAVPIISGQTLLGVMYLYLPADYQEDPKAIQFLQMIARTLAGIIEQHHAQAALRKSEERYMLAARGARDGLWDWDIRLNQIYFSARWKAMLGLDHRFQDTEPAAWYSLVHPDNLSGLQKCIEAHLKGDTPHLEYEYRARHADGEYRWMLVRGEAVRDKESLPIRLAGSQTDITERKLNEEQLLHHAFHDDLTGLPNRALFFNRLGHCLQRQDRRPDIQFAVLLVDLDRFKVVNDSLGHLAGDNLLCDIAGRLAALIRGGDTSARIGGDEFAILLDDIKDLNDATRVAQRLNEELRLPYEVNKQEVYSSASIGIALSSTGYENPEEMLRDADTAMYRAKSIGKGQYQIFNESMHQEALQVMKLENDMRRAIEREEFQLHFQPIVSIKRGGVVALETLVRWEHPLQGLLYPNVFIAIAEETDLIVELGEWILRTACQTAQAWIAGGGPPIRVAVNVSARQFLRVDMCRLVQDVLDDTGLPPKLLELEITESCFMGTGEANIEAIAKLARSGVSISLDDFGTGYSSLHILKTLPIDVLKLDRAFVSELGINDQEEAIASAVISMAKNLNLQVTAEGVETHKQLEVLCRLGYDQLQGFLIARPAPSFEESVQRVTRFMEQGTDKQTQG